MQFSSPAHTHTHTTNVYYSSEKYIHTPKAHNAAHFQPNEYFRVSHAKKETKDDAITPCCPLFYPVACVGDN